MNFTAEQMKTAESSIRTDPFVRDLLETFGASIVPNSIAPTLEVDSSPNMVAQIIEPVTEVIQAPAEVVQQPKRRPLRF